MAEKDDEKVAADAAATPVEDPTPPDTSVLEPEAAPRTTTESPYVVTGTPVEAAKTDRKAVPSGGPVKPETLSTDYVVAADPETKTFEPLPTERLQTEQPKVVYVTAPTPPAAKGNRGIGVLVVLAATLLFAVFLAFATLIFFRASTGAADMAMLANYGYWVPVATFALAFLLVMLVINRGGVWAHILGSAIVAAIVYVGGSAIVVGISRSFGNDLTVFDALVSPVMIAAGIIGREVALWAGVILAHRGRAVKLRNAEARAAFDREQSAARS